MDGKADVEVDGEVAGRAVGEVPAAPLIKREKRGRARFGH